MFLYNDNFEKAEKFLIFTQLDLLMRFFNQNIDLLYEKIPHLIQFLLSEKGYTEKEPVTLDFMLNFIEKIFKEYFLNKKSNQNIHIFYIQPNDYLYNIIQPKKLKNDIFKYYNRIYCSNKLPDGIKQYVYDYLIKKHSKIVPIQQVVDKIHQVLYKSKYGSQNVPL